MKQQQKRAMSKRVLDALDDIKKSDVKNKKNSVGGGRGLQMRTESNTVDLRGLDFSDAQSKTIDFISRRLSSKNNVLFILHGHEGRKGFGLKTRIR